MNGDEMPETILKFLHVEKLLAFQSTHEGGCSLRPISRRSDVSQWVDTVEKVAAI